MERMEKINRAVKYRQILLGQQQRHLKAELVDFTRTDYPQSGDIKVDLVKKLEEIRDTTQINFVLELTDKNQPVNISEEHERAERFSRRQIESLDEITDETRHAVLAALE